MAVDNRLIGRLLSEVLRLQSWAGGDSALAARIFGLLHGFESVLKEERESRISQEIQDKVEDLLSEVEEGKQPASGRAIKDRLRKSGVSEVDAGLVMQLCRLQGRFADTVEKIATAPGSVFTTLLDWRPEEHGWYGALHYLELVDATEGARKKLHAVFSPCIPRVGEIVQPQAGSPMKVVAVEHLVVGEKDAGRGPGVMLTPYVMLEAIEE